MQNGPQNGVAILRAKFLAANSASGEKKQIQTARVESVSATKAKFISGDANNATQAHEQDAALAKSIDTLQRLDEQRQEEEASLALIAQLLEEDAQQMRSNGPRF